MSLAVLSIFFMFEDIFPYNPQPYVDSTGKCRVGYGVCLELYRDAIPFEDIRNGSLRGQALCEALVKYGMFLALDLAKSLLCEKLRLATEALRVKHNDASRLKGLQGVAFYSGVGQVLRCRKVLDAVERGDSREAAVALRNTRWFINNHPVSDKLCLALERGDRD